LKFKIRDAWSIESPNHGDSAILNENKLLSGSYDLVFNNEDYARLVHAMLAGLGKLVLQESGNEREVNTDFSKRTLIAVGHSAGCTALILSQTFHPPIHFDSLLMIEPMLLRQIHVSKSYVTANIVGMAARRQDVWSSRENAWDMFKSRRTWQAWDERILRLYVDHGLREIPSTDPEGRKGVTLKCSKVQEAASYNDKMSQTRAYDFLATICASPTTQVHIIWGSDDEYILPEVKEDIVAAAKGKLASVRRLPGLGHLAPQGSPEGVANAIWATFVGTSQMANL